MRGRVLRSQVNPKVTAIVILVVLAAVQWFWWHGLVTKPKPMAGGPQGGGGGGSGPPTILGYQDVLVDTLAGAPDAGSGDGPGRDARFDGPAGIALAADGALYVADSLNHRIRRVARNGDTDTVAGSEQGFLDGPVAQARFDTPCGIAAGPDGALYVADTGNQKIRCIRAGQVTTLAGSTAGYSDGKGAAARFNLPCAIAYVAGAVPHLIVADAGNQRLREVSLDGTVSAGIALPGAPTSVASGSEILAALPKGGMISTGKPARYQSYLPITEGLVSGSGVAGIRLGHPDAVCAASDGCYIADADHGAVLHQRGSAIEVVAGIAQQNGHKLLGWRDGSGNRALFGGIGALAADGSGHVYVSDTANNAIRVITLPAATDWKEELP